MVESWKAEKKIRRKKTEKEEKEETGKDIKLSSSKLAEETEKEEVQIKQ